MGEPTGRKEKQKIAYVKRKTPLHQLHTLLITLVVGLGTTYLETMEEERVRGATIHQRDRPEEPSPS
ncbi:hypothetical protein RHMOL_Rhmol02G0142200 [Rhododendron molle]|uniref:Uncharacterized protein n=1 Tax=Rhododendron molle TaxID=49168 RepID=A0ACC0PSP0_RHOML|nr:hypothetical protein RHMOL_Rhmol02G0142200 [Rhododendron molle]